MKHVTLPALTVAILTLAASNRAVTAAEDAKSIRPFHFTASKEQLADMRTRIAATRWPDKETVADQSQGVQLATVQKLACYWATEYNWRKIEAKLIHFNRLDKGGHFAAWEQPELFVGELRAAFKSPR